jgi:hypothetical protein
MIYLYIFLLSESISALAREENIKNVKKKTLFLSFLYSSEYHYRVSYRYTRLCYVLRRSTRQEKAKRSKKYTNTTSDGWCAKYGQIRWIGTSRLHEFGNRHGLIIHI